MPSRIFPSNVLLFFFPSWECHPQEALFTKRELWTPAALGLPNLAHG